MRKGNAEGGGQYRVTYFNLLNLLTSLPSQGFLIWCSHCLQSPLTPPLTLLVVLKHDCKFSDPAFMKSWSLCSLPLESGQDWQLQPTENSGIDIMWYPRLSSKKAMHLPFCLLQWLVLELWGIMWEVQLWPGSHALRKPKPYGETMCEHYSPQFQLSPDLESSEPWCQTCKWRSSRDSSPGCWVFLVEPLDIMEQRQTVPNCALSEFLTHRIHEHNRMIVLCH